MRRTRVVIDNRQFLTIDGIKICRITREGLLEFKDKDGRRSRMRGSAYVTVYADQIVQAVETMAAPIQENSGNGSGTTIGTAGRGSSSGKYQYDGQGIQSGDQEENNQTTQGEIGLGDDVDTDYLSGGRFSTGNSSGKHAATDTNAGERAEKKGETTERSGGESGTGGSGSGT